MSLIYQVMDTTSPKRKRRPLYEGRKRAVNAFLKVEKARLGDVFKDQDYEVVEKPGNTRRSADLNKTHFKKRPRRSR